MLRNSLLYSNVKQHFLYFLPEPQGQGELRPIFVRPKFLDLLSSTMGNSVTFFFERLPDLKNLKPSFAC